MAPQLRSVTAAGLRAVHSRAAPWILSASDWFSASETLRGLVAEILNADVDGIALIPAVSYGVAIAARNVPIHGAQSVLVLEDQFPSNVYAWQELVHSRGAGLRFVKRGAYASWTEAVLDSIDSSTAIIAVPNCHWTDGGVLDLVQIGEAARAVDAAFVVDASQSLGAYPLNVAEVLPDFLVSVGYKWLLGPYGLAYLYVAPRWRKAGMPLENSWLSRSGSDDFSRLVEYTGEYRVGARRYDMGEFPQFLLTPMAIAALRQVIEWGPGRIQKSLTKLTRQVEEATAERASPTWAAKDRVGHMIGIRLHGGHPPGIERTLLDAKVFVSLRGDCIRVSPHLYNETRDIEQLLEVLRSR